MTTSCQNRKEKKYKNNIGFIDPATAVGDEGFTACENYVYEYYNSFPHGGYKYGKKAFKDFVMGKFKYEGMDSGFLTFRFVVNCRGVAGRYQIVENDLNYKPTKLNESLVSKLFLITQEAKEWRSIKIDDQLKDYYFYITYKLKDGKVIEILP
jgi:hypothetical protein